ncbi:phosphotransferase [Staphylococcus kloosii]|uniref:phosphotransferase n=1 Tax=Staphylococcus kloosii TaxID=29384 RepID=UPI0028A30634|nr:phosphotransferase [Staphylococcus kloosii]MDT3959790.1 phosphotransferase [Staphylococcus kloosii]
MLINKKIIYKKKVGLIYEYLRTYYSYYNFLNIYSNINTKDVYLEYIYLPGDTLKLNDNKLYSEFKTYLIQESNSKKRKQFNKYLCKDNLFKQEVINYKDFIDQKIRMDLDIRFQKIYPFLKKLLNNFLRNAHWNEEHYISHGDLHCGNIIVNSGLFYLIDFEEISYAPMNFDLTIYIYKYFNFTAGYLNKKSYKYIEMEFMKHNLYISDICIYIIKVIFQKKYLEYEKHGYYANNGEDRWIDWWQDLQFLIGEILDERKNSNNFKTGLFRKTYS